MSALLQAPQPAILLICQSSVSVYRRDHRGLFLESLQASLRPILSPKPLKGSVRAILAYFHDPEAIAARHYGEGVHTGIMARAVHHSTQIG